MNRHQLAVVMQTMILVGYFHQYSLLDRSKMTTDVFVIGFVYLGLLVSQLVLLAKSDITKKDGRKNADVPPPPSK